MPTEIKRNETTLIFDVREFKPLAEAKHYLLCLNENTYHLASNLFLFYGYWLNRYTPNSDGDVWYKVEDDDAVFVRDMYDKGMEELAMTVCFDDLIEAINTNFTNLTGAIEALQLSVTVETTPPGVNVTVNPASPDVNLTCAPDVNLSCNSSGGGGYGSTSVNSPSGSVIDVDPAPDLPSDPNTDPPPDGFDTWTDYNEYKCKAANAMFDSLVAWFRWLSGLDAAAAGTAAGAVFGTWLLAQIGAMLAAAAATTAAGGFAVTTALAGAFTVGFVASAPGWVLAAIVAAIAVVTALVGVGLLIIFDSLADDLEAKKDDVVCQLYEAQTVAEASSILSTALSDSINSFVISAPYDVYEAQLRALGSTVVGYMLPNSFLNQLFERSAVVEAYTASTSDCASCGPTFCEYLFTSDLGDWEQLATYRTISHSASDGGVMVLDGRGGGGSNWSAAKLSAANLAACLGVETTDLILSRLSWEIEYKIFNTTYSTTIFVQARTPEDEYHPYENYLNNVDYEVITGSYPENADLLGEFQIFSGNSGVGSGNEFVMWITRIKIFYTA